MTYADREGRKHNNEYGQYSVPIATECLSLGVGQPSPDLLPIDLLREAWQDMAKEQTNPFCLQYGDQAGYRRFREKLVSFVQRQCPEVTELHPDELFVTPGITGAITLLFKLLAMKERTHVIVEDPTYFLVLNLLREFPTEFEMHEVEMLPTGLDLDQLETVLKGIPEDDRVLLYTIPTYHNPTGFTMPVENRVRLGRIVEARKNMYVLADEAYQYLGFYHDTPPPLFTFHERIVSMHSFSKILAPSLRVGFVMTRSKEIIKMMKDCGELDSSGGVNPLNLLPIEYLIDNEKLDRNIDFLRAELSTRSNDLVDSIVLHCPHLNLIQPTGGYFLWVDAGRSTDVDMGTKIKYHVGTKFSSRGGFGNFLRLSFSWYQPNELAEAGKYLNEVLPVRTKTGPVVWVSGHTGRLGSKICQQLEKSNYTLGKIPRDRSQWDGLEDEGDIILDVSSPEGLKSLLTSLLEIVSSFEMGYDADGAPVFSQLLPTLITGTTGDLPWDLINQYATYGKVVVSANFSRGIPELCRLIDAVSFDGWEVGLEETHHVHKKDKPSGTAKRLKERVATRLGEGLDVPVESFRVGEVFGEHALVLKNKDEELRLTHSAKTRDLFAKGAVRFVDWVISDSFASRGVGVFTEMDYVPNALPHHSHVVSHPELWSGAGNTFAIGFGRMDGDSVLSNAAVKLCEEKKVDGMITLYTDSSDEVDYSWRFFNKDGSEADFCGNGARCVARFLQEFMGTPEKKEYRIRTHSGKVFTCNILEYPNVAVEVEVDSTPISREALKDTFLPGYSIWQGEVNSGVPHWIYFLEDYYSPIKYVERFTPRTDYNLTAVSFNHDKEQWEVATMERGAGLTGACGSGCVAASMFVNSLYQDFWGKKIEFLMPSGEKLTVVYQGADSAHHTLMGPAVPVFVSEEEVEDVDDDNLQQALEVAYPRLSPVNTSAV